MNELDRPLGTSQKLYLILTASNEIYDDDGEDYSLEKMVSAASKRRKELATYEEGQSEDTVITAYRKSPNSRYTSMATLVNLRLTPSGDKLNPYSFFVSSYRTFQVDVNEKLHSEKAKDKPASSCIII